MLVEVIYRNGNKDRRICHPNTTMQVFVEDAEAQHNSKIQSMRIIKRNEHSHRGHKAG